MDKLLVSEFEQNKCDDKNELYKPECNKLLLKKSVGIQWRINGFSFYNFPTALELEYHQPLTTFSRVINNDKITYGDRSKTYVKILFDF